MLRSIARLAAHVRRAASRWRRKIYTLVSGRGVRRAHQLGTTSQRRTPPTTIVVARSDVDPGRFGGNGTGSGDWPGAVAELVPNAEITGIDGDPAWLKTCWPRYGSVVTTAIERLA